MRRVTLMAAWLGATGLATAFAWGVVGAADDQVSERPIVPLQAVTGEPEPATEPTSSADTTTSSSVTTMGDTTPDSTTTTTPTETAIAEDWQVATIPTLGGTVVVSYRSGEVVLGAATPSPGFTVEVDKEGPPEVEVEFEGATLRVEVRVRWQDGQLEVEVDEN